MVVIACFFSELLSKEKESTLCACLRVCETPASEKLKSLGGSLSNFTVLVSQQPGRQPTGHSPTACELPTVVPPLFQMTSHLSLSRASDAVRPEHLCFSPASSGSPSWQSAIVGQLSSQDAGNRVASTTESFFTAAEAGNLSADRVTFSECLSPPCWVLTPWSCICVCLLLKGVPPLLDYPSNLLKGLSPNAIILGGRTLKGFNSVCNSLCGEFCCFVLFLNKM